MINLTYKNLTDTYFGSGFQKLCKETNLPLPVARRIVKIARALNDEKEIYANLYQKLAERYGSISGQHITFHSPESGKAYHEAAAEFLQIKIEIEGDKIKLDQLGEIKLSPAELMAMEPLLEDSNQTVTA